MTSIPHTGRPRESRKPAVSDRVVYGGVDTHKELHVAAVVDGADAVLGTRSFSTTRAGYRALLSWIGEYGQLVRIGVEGTGSYGAGLARHLAKAGVTVLEVDRPDRSDRRRKGKDDDLDAINAHGPRCTIAGPRSRSRRTVPSRHCGCCERRGLRLSVSGAMPCNYCG